MVAGWAPSERQLARAPSRAAGRLPTVPEGHLIYAHAQQFIWPAPWPATCHGQPIRSAPVRRDQVLLGAVGSNQIRAREMSIIFALRNSLALHIWFGPGEFFQRLTLSRHVRLGSRQTATCFALAPATVPGSRPECRPSGVVGSGILRLLCNRRPDGR